MRRKHPGSGRRSQPRRHLADRTGHSERAASLTAGITSGKFWQVSRDERVLCDSILSLLENQGRTQIFVTTLESHATKKNLFRPTISSHLRKNWKFRKFPAVRSNTRIASKPTSAGQLDLTTSQQAAAEIPVNVRETTDRPAVRHIFRPVKSIIRAGRPPSQPLDF